MLRKVARLYRTFLLTPVVFICLGIGAGEGVFKTLSPVSIFTLTQLAHAQGGDEGANGGSGESGKRRERPSVRGGLGSDPASGRSGVQVSAPGMNAFGPSTDSADETGDATASRGRSGQFRQSPPPSDPTEATRLTPEEYQSLEKEVHTLATARETDFERPDVQEAAQKVRERNPNLARQILGKANFEAMQRHHQRNVGMRYFAVHMPINTLNFYFGLAVFNMLQCMGSGVTHCW